MSENNSTNNESAENEQNKPEEKQEEKSEEKPIENPEEKKEEKSEEKKEEKVDEKKEEKPKEKTEESFKQKEIDPKSFCCVPTLIKTNTFNAPFPIRLTMEQLTYIFDKDYLKDYLIKDYQGVYCLNQEVIDKQKEVITQLTKCLWSGTAMSLSLPIRIFEPRSMLERYTDWFAFAPDLLTKAGECTDKIEAFKYVVVFSLSALFRSSEQLKPLNPMLGETYECEWKDGTKCYVEHTNHTPPISHFYIKSAKNLFIISGYIQMEMGGIMKAMFKNAMLMVPKGKVTVYLPKLNQRINYQFPKITMGGALWGQRHVYFSDHMKFEDPDNNIKAIIAFGNAIRELKGKRIHDIYGKIFKYQYNNDDLDQPFYSEYIPSYPFPSNKDDIISEITGSWLEDIIIDNKVYLSIKETVSPQIYPCEKVLDSDARYREDKEWLQLSWDNKEFGKTFEGYAQCWKLALEAQQRFDRGLRKEWKDKRGKKK